MKLKPYPKYKESGVQWIGEVPEEWCLERFKIRFKSKKGKIPENLEELNGEGYLPYLSMEYLRGKEDGVLFSKDSKSLKVEEGDLLLLWDGSNAGEFISAKKGFLSSTMVKLSIERMDKPFSKYLCSAFEPMLRALTVGMGIPHVNGDVLGNIQIPIFEIENQQKIASFLDLKTSEISKTIEKDKKLIELLKEKRTALINHVVTKGLNPKAKMKDSGIEWIGKVPEGWEVVPLLKFLESKVDYRGATPEKVVEGVFLVTGRNIKEGKIDYELSQEFVLEDQYKEIMHRGKPQIGDLLFTTEAPLGEVANVDNETVALAQRIIKMRGQKYKLDNYYLKYYIMTALFQRHLQGYATGSTALGIKASNMCFLRLIVPSLKEQSLIVQYLDKATSKIDNTIQKIEKKIGLLEEYKKSLIHHVVTGKVDVREAAA
ncbi:MAG: restriction endonuclease subunit S [Thermoplasmatales archaeon]|nr:restriction endonuclease subunit S [Thermoplasmatales archaeon]